MNAFALPDGRPFHAGTYFPPEDRGGMPGFPRVLAGAHRAFVEQGDKVRQAGHGAHFCQVRVNAVTGETRIDRWTAVYAAGRILNEKTATSQCYGGIVFGIGAALTGLRPIVELQFSDFTQVAMDQIVNQAAKWHYMFGGQVSVPLVIRMIVGRGWGQGRQQPTL